MVCIQVLIAVLTFHAVTILRPVVRVLPRILHYSSVSSSQLWQYMHILDYGGGVMLSMEVRGNYLGIALEISIVLFL